MDIRKIMENAKVTGVAQVASTKEFIPYVYDSFAKHLAIKGWNDRYKVDPKIVNKVLGRRGFALVENENGSRMSLVYKGDED